MATSRRASISAVAAGLITAAALAVISAPVTAADAGDAGVTQAAASGPVRPNIVLITTDDQSLDEMAWMPKTRRQLGSNGVTFTGALSPAPLCCPARAEIVTGQYGQNNGVRSNDLSMLAGA